MRRPIVALVALVISLAGSAQEAAADTSIYTCGQLQALQYPNGVRSEPGQATIDGTSYRLSATWSTNGTNLIKRSATVGSTTCLQGTYTEAADEVRNFTLLGCSEGPGAVCQAGSNPLPSLAGWLVIAAGGAIAMTVLGSRRKAPRRPFAHRGARPTQPTPVEAGVSIGTPTAQPTLTSRRAS